MNLLALTDWPLFPQQKFSLIFPPKYMKLLLLHGYNIICRLNGILKNRILISFLSVVYLPSKPFYHSRLIFTDLSSKHSTHLFSIISGCIFSIQKVHPSLVWSLSHWLSYPGYLFKLVLQFVPSHALSTTSNNLLAVFHAGLTYKV